MADRVDQQLGNYRLTRLIGEGGFAEVYLAEHLHLGTQAAIKMLHTQLTSDDVDKFRAEARTIAQLVHPHIIRVLDFGVENKLPFLVMDYAPFGTLRQRHPKGTQLPLPTIVGYVKQIAEALQYAHNEKVIHRDIKPENMLLGRHQDVLLSDFGIALISQSSRYQSTQDVVGTISYMAPEHIQGKPRRASDQYALGIVVYEWLSGDRPFHGSFTELCTQHMFAPPPPLREKIPAIPPDIERVIMIALAKDPNQRFQSVQAFARALEQASQPTPYTPIGPKSPFDHLPTLQASSDAQSSIAPPPPPPPQPYAQASLSQEVALPVSDRRPVEIKTPPQAVQPPASNSGPAEQIATPESPREKVNIWKIEKRQAAAMLLSIALSICLAALGGWFFASHSGNNIADIVEAIIFLGFAEVIPLFFGAIFGPWVGFFVGGVDLLLGGCITFFVYDATRGYSSFSIQSYISSLAYNWPLFLAVALIGFVTGLAILKTRGRYNHIKPLAITEGVSALGAVVIITIAGLILSGGSPYFMRDLPRILLFCLPGLILLPIMLFLYDKIMYRRKGTT